MYFTEEKNPKFYKRAKLFALLDDFSNSGIRVAKLEDWRYVNVHVGRNTIERAARYFKFHGIKVRVCGEEIYLINENVTAKGEGMDE